MKRLPPLFASYRYVGLFCALIVLMLISGIVWEAEAGDTPLAVMFSLLLIFAVNAASARRWHLLTAILLAIPWLVVRWTAFLLDSPLIEAIATIILAVLLFFTIGIVIAHVMSVAESDVNFICGALSVYFLMALAWAMSYVVIEAFDERSFAIDRAEGKIPLPNFLYFSLTTLTTLGYGDITPLKPFARIWSTLEAATGVLYTTVLVARLVAIFRR